LIDAIRAKVRVWLAVLGHPERWSEWRDGARRQFRLSLLTIALLGICLRVIQVQPAALAILCAYRLSRAWQAELNLISAVDKKEDEVRARAFIEELRDLCRIPASANTMVLAGTLEEAVRAVPQSDMDILGMRKNLDLEFVRDMVRLTRSSCMLTMDSGLESALA
jgi:Prokaryotic cation-chloride cotransporter, C-terminal domain, 2nd